MNKPKLSVIVPIHMASGKMYFLEEWFSNLSVRDIEVIFCIDGFDENTELEFSNILKTRPDLNPLVVRGNFGSPGLARNMGLEKATGEWVAFWDCDDLPHVNNVMESIFRAEILGDDCIIGEFEIQNSNSQILNKRHPLKPNFLQRISSNPGLWRFVFTRSSIGNLRFTSHIMAEDQIFLARYNIGNRKIYPARTVFYTYIKGYGNQLTSNKKAISQISNATKFLLIETQSMDKFNKILAHELIFKQILTGLKLGNVKSKFTSLVLLVSNLRLLSFFLYRKNLSTSMNVFLTGGLGNQLFQLSAALAMCEKRSIVVNTNFGSPRMDSKSFADLEFLKLENVWFESKRSILTKIISRGLGLNLRIGINKKSFVYFSIFEYFVKKITELLLTLVYKKSIHIFVAPDVGYFNELPNAHKNIFMVGYFQSYKWLGKSNIVKLINSYQVSNSIIIEHKVLAEKENPLAVQIRLTDYLENDSIGLLGIDYYKKAIQRAFENMEFQKIWLFSDDPEKALGFIPAEYFKKLRIIAFPGQSPFEDLELLKLCSAYVISNSTFGWWGATLSYNENGCVFAPAPWFKKNPPPMAICSPMWNFVSGWT